MNIANDDPGMIILVHMIKLQDLFDMRSHIVNYCGATQYYLQLIASQEAKGYLKFTGLFLHKNVANLISSAVLLHSRKF